MAELIDIKGDFDMGNRFPLDVAKYLAARLGEKNRVIVKYDSQDYDFTPDKTNFVFSLGRENHQVPKDNDNPNVKLIFHNYCPLDHWLTPIDLPKVIPMPLGPFVDNMEMCPPLPFAKRIYDFSFVGQLPHTGNRDKFQRCVDKMLAETGSKYKCYIHYTDGFGEGLDQQTYIELLNNTKIALCPMGACSAETFRFYEALKMGAFPMVEWMPKFWFYEYAPMFFTRWESLDNSLSKTLNFLNSGNVQPFDSIAAYNNMILDPKNLANHLLKEIHERLRTN